MITDLLENLLELSFNSVREVAMTTVTVGADSWITPQGKVVLISAADHVADAVRILGKMGYKVSRNLADSEKIFKTLGEKAGYIRMKISRNELDFDIITPQVTSKQISAMKQLAESYSVIYFSIGSMGGVGWKDLITELRRLGMIKESIDEQLHTGEWGFIDSRGKRITDIENHAVYALQYLKKHKISYSKHEEGIIAAFLSSVRYVRYYIENEEVGFTVVVPVTSLQLSVIRRISREAGRVMFDILDKEGESLKWGGGISKLIFTLKNMDLLEKILSDQKVSTGKEVFGWITSSGKLIDIGNVEHARDAVSRMAKLTGKQYSSDYKAYMDLMQLTGYVRLHVTSSEISVTVERKITSKQLSIVREYTEDIGLDFYYDVRDHQTNKWESGCGYRNFVASLRKVNLIESVSESSIDFPRKDLDPSVWLKEDDTYKIRPDVRRKILAIIGKYPDMDLIDTAAAGISDAATIHIVGSIGTNQFLDDSDMDVHIVVSKDSDFHGDVDFQDKVIKWFNEHRDEVGGYIDKHPIEIYLQYDPDQDLMSDGCYDLLADKWLTGPKIVPLDFDPYEDFSGIADDLRNAVEYADRLFGELKRDVIDYSVIEQAMNQLLPEQKELFLGRLKSKLEEIEEDIKALYMKRKEWVDARRMASKPSNPEEALKDVELARRWKDENALFKFVNRYQYLKTIKALEKLLADDEISPSEVDTIRGIVGGV